MIKSYLAKFVILFIVLVLIVMYLVSSVAMFPTVGELLVFSILVVMSLLVGSALVFMFIQR